MKSGVSVTKIINSESSVEIYYGDSSEKFDLAVVATTGDVAQKILVNVSNNARTMFEKLKYAKTMTVAFEIPSDLFPSKTHLTYVPFVENSVVSGYDNQIRKSAMLEKDGRSVLMVYLHENAAEKLSLKPETEAFNDVLSELKKVCPEVREHESEVKPLSCRYWSKAMPKFSSNYLEHVVNFENDGQGENNIYLAGDYLNSVWAEGAARCGKRVAEHIINNAKPQRNSS